MGSLRLAILGGGLLGAALVGACGLELGGVDGAPDSGEPDVFMGDATADNPPIPDSPMDIMTPDLGTGETDSGALCTCTPALPNGWAFVTYDGMGRPACPMQYGSQLDTFESPTAAATQCVCTCNGVSTQPTCGGDAKFNYGFGTTNNSCNKTSGQVTCSPGCTMNAATQNGGGGDFAYLTFSGTITPMGGTCNAPTTSMMFPAATSQPGRVCQLQGSPGTCGVGACVPTPSAGYAVCVQKAGNQTCPLDFPNTHYVGDSVSDNRSCGPNACNCTLDIGTCTTPQVSSYWGSTNCTTMGWGSNPQAADGTCKATTYNGGGPVNIQSCKYTSSPSGNAACTMKGTFAPQGNLGLNNMLTICCL